MARYNAAAYANAADVYRAKGDDNGAEAMLRGGLAHFALEAGNRDPARAYVRELRELEPDEPAYARLAAQIEGEAGGR